MKKLIAATLALFTVFLSLTSVTSCAKETVTPAPTTEAATTEAETKEENAQSILNSFDKTDYSGYAFRVLCANHYNSNIYVQQAPDSELSGEPVNDALYLRDQLLEDYFNIDINYTIMGNDDDGTLVKNAKQSIMAGDNTYDLILGSMGNGLPTLVLSGSVLDFNTVDSIDLKNDWWNKNAINDLEINGKIFMATGDITTRYVTSAFMLLFNKNLFNDYKYEYPYQSVNNGTWTIDALNDIIKDKASDLNGDQKINKNDFVGLTPEGGSVYAFYIGSGQRVFSFNNNIPEISCMNSESYDVIDRLIEIIHSNDVLKESAVYDADTMFKNSKSLFLSCAACDISLLRDMADDFGILPMPKYSEAQEKYYSLANIWISTAAVLPVTITDLNKIGTITEAFAAVSKYTSIPAQYEITMQQKQTRDENSINMMKIAVESTTYELSSIYNWGSLGSIIEDAIINGKSYVSTLESHKEKALIAIQDTLDIFSEINTDVKSS